MLLNNKNGTFAGAVTYTVGNQPYQVAIGDVNGDGHPDLAVTNYGANTVSILFGSKTGTFTVRRPRSPPAQIHTASPSATSSTTAFPSVAVTCYNSVELEIFPNNGNGTFGTPFIYR